MFLKRLINCEPSLIEGNDIYPIIVNIQKTAGLPPFIKINLQIKYYGKISAVLST